MNIFKKLGLKLVKSFLLKKIQDDEFREKLATVINKKVDVPKLTEKQEQKLIKALIDAVCVYINAL